MITPDPVILEGHGDSSIDTVQENVMRHRLGWVVVLGALLSTLPLATAAAQDTLSDSAWNADRARRAAMRQKAQTALDSAARLVDTIVVRPDVINLRVGDTVPTQLFYGRVTSIGLTARGDTVRAFSRTLSISRGAAIEMRNGVLIAREPGTAEVRVGAGRRFNPDDVSRPMSRIPIVVHEQ
jgi:hypothetical protein